VGDHDLQVFLKSLHNELDTVALHPDPVRMVSVLLTLPGLAGGEGGLSVGSSHRDTGRFLLQQHAAVAEGEGRRQQQG
jgi:hypothetical protein